MKKVTIRSRVRKLLQGSSRGLTLVEVVIAIALIGIIAVAFLGGLSNAIFSVHLADVRTTAESLARSEMEIVKHDPIYRTAPWGPDIKHNPSGHDGFSVTISAVPLNGDDDGIQKVTVTVSYKDRGDIITLVGYKVNQ